MHGLYACVGHMGDVVTRVHACGMLKWVLRLKPYR